MVGRPEQIKACPGWLADLSRKLLSASLGKDRPEFFWQRRPRAALSLSLAALPSTSLSSQANSTVPNPASSSSLVRDDSRALHHRLEKRFLDHPPLAAR
jgi:hypothetical protein